MLDFYRFYVNLYWKTKPNAFVLVGSGIEIGLGISITLYTSDLALLPALALLVVALTMQVLAIKQTTNLRRIEKNEYTA